jgi:hypothetical protein
VEPLNLNESGDTLDFSVSMNTHSVDVGWDLAALATLETDAGINVGASGWPIGSGHHYGGTLSFPRLAADGADLLEEKCAQVDRPGHGRARTGIHVGDLPDGTDAPNGPWLSRGHVRLSAARKPLPTRGDG